MSRTAVVAGVGPRLGESLARKFVSEGYNVGLFARSEDYLRDLGADLGERALAVPTDITDETAVRAGFDRVREAFGPVDVLVNNAYSTAGEGEGVLGTSRAGFESAWRVWTYGPFLCTEQAIADMLDNDGGTVVFTGARASVRGLGESPGAASACFAMRGLARSLADRLGPEGVHVATVLLDGNVDGPEHSEPTGMSPDAIAETYWHLVQQDEHAWTLECDLRAHNGDVRF